MSNLILKYGNVISGLSAGQAVDHSAVKIGDLATIIRGRDRDPGKVAGIEYAKNGKVKGYHIQSYHWTIDFETEGYAKEIQWDRPNGTPSYHKVYTHGHLKGCIKDAFLGRADAFYDRSF